MKIDDKELASLILATLPIAIVTTDGQFEITSFNPQAEELTGYAAREAVGKNCNEILGAALCEKLCPEQLFSSSPAPFFIREETSLTSRTSANLPVMLHAAVMHNERREPIGCLAAFQEISREKEIKQKKVNFQSMIAHDMKSPLITIEGLTNRLLARSEEIEPAKQRQYLETINGACAQLNALLKEFLEFARLETGHLQLKLTDSNVNEELKQIIETHQTRAAEKKIDIKLETEEALPKISADTDRLRRVFNNLIDNAIKFSENYSTISITAKETEKEVLIRFADKGAGIDRRHLPFIFDAFFHRGPAKKQTKGYGLGLATVQAIVSQHGGKVQVSSEKGKGSVFTIRLPKKNPAGNEQANL